MRSIRLSRRTTNRHSCLCAFLSTKSLYAHSTDETSSQSDVHHLVDGSTPVYLENNRFRIRDRRSTVMSWLSVVSDAKGQVTVSAPTTPGNEAPPTIRRLMTRDTLGHCRPGPGELGSLA